jgi:hypothetical protein
MPKRKAKKKKFAKLEDKQRTVEWFAERMGHITGSQRIGTYMTNTGNPHALNRLLDELADELTWSTQQIADQFELEQAQANEYMRWGSAHELKAAETYQMINNADIIYSPGFIEHPEWPCFGVSQDFIDTTNEWLGEIKCPGKEGNHAKTVRYGMGKWHVDQTQLQLECSPAQGMLIFVSYDPRHPVKKDVLFQQLQQRNDDWVARFRSKAREFNEHLKAGTRFKHAVVQNAEGVPQLF